MDAWDKLRWLFDTYDGGLHDIALTGLNELNLKTAFDFVRSHSTITPGAEFWHYGLERSEPVAEDPDVTQLVAQGVAAPFHVLAQGLKFVGACIPDLGVFVLPNELAFDYRMGPEWDRPQLNALFEMFRLIAVAMDRQVEDVIPQINPEFVSEWKAYSATVAGD